MTDIESQGYPLVYKASVNAPVPPGMPVQDEIIAIRTKVRALTGMQKEALVYFGPTGTTWRMVSDEGPHLNGTDLAPFPLAFFATGMALSFVDELLKHASAAGITFKRCRLIQDNFYTMDGSAIRGDMIGGAGSSLKSTQKRTLHVHSICTLREDGLKEVKVQLFKPLGSTFQFIGDESDLERAPPSLAYLAAGIGFCFMTQIGRYAFIVKQDLKKYSIVQDTVYYIEPDSASAKPVDTHTFLQTGEPDQAAQKTLCMSERTCFLHAAMRGSNETQINLQLNGRILDA